MTLEPANNKHADHVQKLSLVALRNEKGASVCRKHKV